MIIYLFWLTSFFLSMACTLLVFSKTFVQNIQMLFSIYLNSKQNLISFLWLSCIFFIFQSMHYMFPLRKKNKKNLAKHNSCEYLLVCVQLSKLLVYALSCFCSEYVCCTQRKKRKNQWLCVGSQQRQVSKNRHSNTLA